MVCRPTQKTMITKLNIRTLTMRPSSDITTIIIKLWQGSEEAADEQDFLRFLPNEEITIHQLFHSIFKFLSTVNFLSFQFVFHDIYFPKNSPEKPETHVCR